MLKSRRHLYHMVDPSPWPLLVSLGIFFFVSGLAFYMHKIMFGGFICLLGFIVIVLVAFFWFWDIVDESTYSGYHTQAVQAGLREGFFLFLASEIMLFFGFFWAFFASSLSPTYEIGFVFPPTGLYTIPVFEFPLFNTLLLLVSGISVTWAHGGVSCNSLKNSIDGLLITIFLGFLFVVLQGFEYYESSFNFFDSVYACSFFMLTGLHGLHVIVGACFLFICLVRLLRGHYSITHHLSFLMAIWYWHFVDVVWIFLFVSVYCWGSW